MKQRLYRIVLTTLWFVPAVALAASGTPEAGGISGQQIATIAAAQPAHLPPVTEVKPPPAWLKGSYLLGTWKVVGEWGHTGGETFPAVHKAEEQQMGSEITFTKNKITASPLFPYVGSCAAQPSYAVKIITLHISDSPVSPGYLNFWGTEIPSKYWPPNWGKAIEIKARCASHKHPRHPGNYSFQLTRTGELAYGGPGFYLLKKIKP